MALYHHSTDSFSRVGPRVSKKLTSKYVGNKYGCQLLQRSRSENVRPRRSGATCSSVRSCNLELLDTYRVILASLVRGVKGDSIRKEGRSFSVSLKAVRKDYCCYGYCCSLFQHCYQLQAGFELVSVSVESFAGRIEPALLNSS